MNLRHIVHAVLLAGCSTLYSSCALIKAPFTIAGAVVEGTYNVGEKVVTTPFDAYDKRQAKKDAEKEQEEKKAEKEKARNPQQAPQPQGTPLLPAENSGEVLPLPPIAPPQ